MQLRQCEGDYELSFEHSGPIAMAISLEMTVSSDAHFAVTALRNALHSDTRLQAVIWTFSAYRDGCKFQNHSLSRSRKFNAECNT